MEILIPILSWFKLEVIEEDEGQGPEARFRQMNSFYPISVMRAVGRETVADLIPDVHLL